MPKGPKGGPATDRSRFAASADDIEMLGELIRSDSTMCIEFWPDAPDEIAKPWETAAESLPRLAISHVRHQGNDAESLSVLRACLESASASTDIVIGEIEPVGLAGARFEYLANQGRERVSVTLTPIPDPGPSG
jgi:hypothetical protein